MVSKLEASCNCSETSAVFMVSLVFQIVLFTVTQMPVCVFFRNFYANCVVLVLILFITTWNGATFYMEVFVLRYTHMHKNYYTKRLLKAGKLRSLGVQCGSANNLSHSASNCSVDLSRASASSLALPHSR